MAYKIDQSKCIKCGSCAGSCPVQAIADNGNGYVINKDVCISCGLCASICPVGAISPDAE